MRISEAIERLSALKHELGSDADVVVMVEEDGLFHLSDNLSMGIVHLSEEEGDPEELDIPVVAIKVTECDHDPISRRKGLTVVQ